MPKKPADLPPIKVPSMSVESLESKAVVWHNKRLTKPEEDTD